jgi:hypothetical protein
VNAANKKSRRVERRPPTKKDSGGFPPVAGVLGSAAAIDRESLRVDGLLLSYLILKFRVDAGNKKPRLWWD